MDRMDVMDPEGEALPLVREADGPSPLSSLLSPLSSLLSPLLDGMDPEGEALHLVRSVSSSTHLLLSSSLLT
jgi:hypothetical protein